MELHLYRCNNSTFLATDEHIVSEHVQRSRNLNRRKHSVSKLPDSSVVIMHNQTYDLKALTKIGISHIKKFNLKRDKPLSLMIDERLIKASY